MDDREKDLVSARIKMRETFNNALKYELSLMNEVNRKVEQLINCEIDWKT
ncbi:MAG: hypothetical protein AAGF54_16475 [Pseudomonadota bacterium]